MTTTVAVYDTKPYDREALARAEGADQIDWRFLEFRPGPDTTLAASGARAVCVFVSDDAGRGVPERLAGLGVVCSPCAARASTRSTCRPRFS